MLLAATNADDRIGENRGESEFPGPIDDFHGILSIDECLRDNESRAQRADSRL
jgi:hypothetical protein